METIQVRINAILEALGTNPNEFAIQHNLSVSTLYNIANGKRLPRYETLVEICQADARISAEYLLRGEGPVLRDLDALQPDRWSQRMITLKNEVLAVFDRELMNRDSQEA